MTSGNKCIKKNEKGSTAAKSTDKKEMQFHLKYTSENLDLQEKRFPRKLSNKRFGDNAISSEGKVKPYSYLNAEIN